MIFRFDERLVLPQGFVFPSRVLLSPMEGVMTPCFIDALTALEIADSYITPFISVTGGNVPAKRIMRRRLEPFLRSGLPVTVQIIGREPEPVSICAERCAELGYRSVNLNFACPSPVVVRGGSGGGMLGSPETMEKIIAAVRRTLPDNVSLSVKLRAGRDSDRTEDVVKASVNGGAEMIIFHFRTAKEMYYPVPDGHDRIRRAALASGTVPVIGNGDIRTAGDALRMAEETGVAGVAVARGAAADPALLRHIKGDAGFICTRGDFHAALEKYGAKACSLREYERMSGIKNRIDDRE